MADFLNNLVARTLNLAPVVQPRLASRFEPVRPQVGDTTIEQSVEVEAPAPAPRMTLRQPETVGSVPPGVVQPVVEREHSRVDVQQVINTVRNTRVESREVVREKTERIEPRIQTEKTDFVLREREVTKVVPAKEVTASEKVVPRVEAPRVAAKPSVVEVVREKEKPEKTREVIVPQTVIRKEPAPLVAPPPKRIEVVPALATEPKETISVTIGRVDVRAVFSPQQQTSAPVPRRQSSINALDDYLKQRSEGRR